MSALVHALAHARDEFPKEACGLIAIVRGREKYFPCKNDALHAENCFIIAPHDYVKVEDQGEIVMIVHSHTDGTTEFSEIDKKRIEDSTIPWLLIEPKRGSYNKAYPPKYNKPYVGRPFIHGVHDCYTLVQDYFFREFNIKLPTYNVEDKWWLKGKNYYAENYLKEGFVEVTSAKENDIFLIKSGSAVMNHAAIYIGNMRILHHVQYRLSSLDLYRDYWQKNTELILRHESLL